MIFVGLDIGSRAIKLALMDGSSSEILTTGLSYQTLGQSFHSQNLLDSVLVSKGIKPNQIARTVSTGYGRNSVAFADQSITEITCHAAGVRFLVPSARTIFDIGGQDSKFIRLDDRGRVEDFAMNDRCAAGTGCFLEMVASRLNLPVSDLGQLANKSQHPAQISSMCAVFAETEIIGLLTQNTLAADIIAGVQIAVSTRIAAMAGPRIPEPVFLTGGVAMIGGMDTALASVLGKPVKISPFPQFTGAIGAAVLALKQYKANRDERI